MRELYLFGRTYIRLHMREKEHIHSERVKTKIFFYFGYSRVDAFEVLSGQVVVKTCIELVAKIEGRNRVKKAGIRVNVGETRSRHVETENYALSREHKT